MSSKKRKNITSCRISPKVDLATNEGGGRKKVVSELKTLADQLRSVVEEAEAIEKEPIEQLKLEATMKRYTFNNKAVRRIHISERFNTREELDKYDKATEKGHRYCMVTIELIPTKINLAEPTPEQ